MYSASGSGLSKVFFSVWYRIQRIIQNCPGYYSASGSVFSVLLKKCPGFYSAPGLGFSVLLKMSRVLFSVCFSIQRIIKKCQGYYSTSGSGFSVRLTKNVQGIIQRLVQDSAYYSKLSRVLFSVWFRIQRIIKKCQGYYLASGSVFSVLLKMSWVLFSIRFRIQRTIH